ncbi:hypothetical protein BDP27DRAFT_1423666 [Rhodocollybia butyracea]|uniref:DUF659 domain-containing protein n=1 Tax=Rhodocollybia butyracea TaxID=206335 RepID=A0A9P5PRG3_9AGAR|nr:hypothetical protein BDP27DRAFT_1423666 [Rhodocollybia butyracea]
MARQKGEMWQFFWKGQKENSSHHRAYCLGCVRNQLGHAQLSDDDTLGLSDEITFKNACTAVGSVLGERKAMVAHVLGGEKACKHASSPATEKAKELRKKDQKGKRARTEDIEEDDTNSTDNQSPAPSKKHKAVDRVVKHQTKLKVFKGISVPFSDKQEKEVHAQFLCATVSANLHYSWVSDPEVIKLFLMFRSCAGDVIPSREVLAGRLLKEEQNRVEEELKSKLKKQEGHIDDISKNSLMGVNVSSEFQPHLVDLYNATADKKDGDSMEEALDKMIEKTEKRYGCTVAALGTDNDGRTRSGRGKIVIRRRPWLLTFPCGAHQGHLSVADYFKVNPDAAETSEQATALIGWLNNHGRVRSIFDAVQKEKTWKDLKVNFQEIHGDDPIIFWESMKADAKVTELAEFALLILYIVVNTAGNERQFSHVKIKKSHLRNRLLLEKLESELKIGENLREHHYSNSLRDIRKPRQNHSVDRVSKLLEVPRYGDLVTGDDLDGRLGSALVTSRRHWRAELNRWKEDAQGHDELYAPPPPLPQGASRAWLPRSFNLLFGQLITDNSLETRRTGGTRPRRATRTVFSEEQLMMELLAQEKDDEILDDGALEGSGDEYDGN